MKAGVPTPFFFCFWCARSCVRSLYTAAPSLSFCSCARRSPICVPLSVCPANFPTNRKVEKLASWRAPPPTSRGAPAPPSCPRPPLPSPAAGCLPPAGNGDSTMHSQHSAITALCYHPVSARARRVLFSYPAGRPNPLSLLPPPDLPHPAVSFTVHHSSRTSPSLQHLFLLHPLLSRSLTRRVNHRLRSPPDLTPPLAVLPRGRPIAAKRPTLYSPPALAYTCTHPAALHPPPYRGEFITPPPTTAPPLSPRSRSYPGVNHQTAPCHPAPPSSRGAPVSFQFIPPCARTSPRPFSACPADFPTNRQVDKPESRKVGKLASWHQPAPSSTGDHRVTRPRRPAPIPLSYPAGKPPNHQTTHHPPVDQTQRAHHQTPTSTSFSALAESFSHTPG